MARFVYPTVCPRCRIPLGDDPAARTLADLPAFWEAPGLPQGPRPYRIGDVVPVEKPGPYRIDPVECPGCGHGVRGAAIVRERRVVLENGSKRIRFLGQLALIGLDPEATAV